MRSDNIRLSMMKTLFVIPLIAGAGLVAQPAGLDFKAACELARASTPVKRDYKEIFNQLQRPAGATVSAAVASLDAAQSKYNGGDTQGAIQALDRAGAIGIALDGNLTPATRYEQAKAAVEDGAKATGEATAAVLSLAAKRAYQARDYDGTIGTPNVNSACRQAICRSRVDGTSTRATSCSA
jgi:hypothetical protein